MKSAQTSAIRPATILAARLGATLTTTLKNPALQAWIMIVAGLLAFLFTATKSRSQVMQRGISVQMAATSYATPMPGADSANALIVSVTSEGNADFGLDPVTPPELTDKLKASLANRQRKFYLKADARAPYSAVTKVLESALSAGIGIPMLLTAQPASTASGAIEPPKGLSALIAPPTGLDKIGAEKKVVVWVFDSPQHGPTLTLNGQPLSWSELQGALNQLLQNRSEKMVVVNADGSIPYAQVVHVVDLCQSASAKAILVTPEP